MLDLKPIKLSEKEQFKRLVELYWQEVMPYADVISNPIQKETYFHNQFKWQDQQQPYWALVSERHIGFVNFTLNLNNHAATIDDFYVLSSERRKGNGTKMVSALYTLLQQWEIDTIELSVRRDTPAALSFWESMGFRIAQYRMRQFRDTETGQWLIGALSSDFVE